MSRGPRLEDEQEKLLRQVHPHFINAGRLSSQAFRPTMKDEGELSVSMGSRTTPAQAFDLHTQRKQLASAGVWSVTVGDCSALTLAAYADPIEGLVPDPAHAVIDFRQHPPDQFRKIGQLLAHAAVCQYTATVPE